MSENKKNEYFDKNFYISFLEGLDHHNRYAVTAIDSICKEMANCNDPALIKECISKINYQCSQIMKLSEIYTAVSNLISDNEIENGSINAGKFISDFVADCEEYLNEAVCQLNVTNFLIDSDIYISFDNVFVDKKILEFVIAVTLRKMIINGASVIDLKAENTKNEIVISLKTVKADPPAPEEIMSETISIDLSDEIIKASADRLNSKFDVRNNRAKFRFPISPKNVLGQPLKDEKKYFNMFNNLFSDLEIIKSYTKDNKK